MARHGIDTGAVEISSLEEDPSAKGWATNTAWTALAGLAALLALVLSFFWPLITPDEATRWFIEDGDFTRQFFPYHAFSAAELWSGRVPLWNPYIFGGHPFLADIQTAFFYPPGLAFNLVFGADGLTLPELQYRVVLAYLMAAAFTYAFVRALTSSNGAAVVSGLTFTLGGFLTSYPMQQLPILETALWLPLILLFVHRANRSRSWLRETVFGSVALTCAFLAGHPQTIMFMVYIIAGYAVFDGLRSWTTGVDGTRQLARHLAAAVGRLPLLGALAVALSAVQLLPTLELMSLSNRVGLSYEAASGGNRVNSLLAAVLPDWSEGHSVYVGLLALALAVLAILRSPSRDRWFWAVCAVLFAVLSLGDNGPLYSLFYSHVPGFGLFRSQERAIFVYSFAVSVLAGLGAASLAGAAPRRLARPLSLLLTVIPAAALVALAVLIRSATPSDDASARLLAALATGAACYWLFRKKSIHLLGRGSWLAALAALTVIDLFAVNFGINFTGQATGVSSSAQLAAQVIREDAVQRDAELYRVRVQTADEDLFPPNYAQLLGQPQAGGDTPFHQQRLADLWQANDEWRFWELMNVAYTVSRRDLGSALDFVGWADELRVYRMPYALPRAWAVRDVRPAGSAEEALALTFLPEVGPGKAAVVEGASWLSFSDPIVPGHKQTLVDYFPQRLAYDVELERDALFVLSEANYPGWRAWVDGHETPVLSTSYYLRGVVVPAGVHRVEMAFASSSFHLGAMISAGTALALTLLVFAPPLVGAITRRQSRAT